MYPTCIFCNASLGRNDVIEAFPVGRRLAFRRSWSAPHMSISDDLLLSRRVSAVLERLSSIYGR